MQRLFLFFLVFMTLESAIAQTVKQKQLYEQVWIGYFNQTRFNNKWGLSLDAQLRSKDNFFDSLSIAEIRPGIVYYLSDIVNFTVGYAYFNHFPIDNHSQISQPEHRLWQQVQWNANSKRIKLSQRIRLEERWRRKIKDMDELANGYYFNFRARYNFLFQVALSKKAFEPGSFSYVLNDELMVNFGKEIVYNSFDQNRFFTGFNYFFNRQTYLQFGYLNVFQQQTSGNKYRVINAARILVFHNLDFRRK